MGNKVRFGLKKAHVAFETAPGTYETPTPIPGAVSLSKEPQGDTTEFYADDVLYYLGIGNQGYNVELELALVPSEILAEMLGWEVDSNGVLVEIADAEPKPFALMHEIDGDIAGTRHIAYRCTASRPSDTASTKTASVEPQTQTLPVRVWPVVFGEKTVVGGQVERSEQTASVYDSWFTTVHTPDFGSGSASA